MKDVTINQNVSDHSFSLPIAQPLLRNALGFCLFVAAFYFAYRFGMSFSQTTSSPFWFPDSVLLCALLVVRSRNWWLFVLATLPIRLLAPVSAGIPLWFLLVTFANDAIKGVLTAAALRRYLRNPLRFETVREFGLYCLFAVLLAPAASAFGGAAARHALGNDFWLAFEQWFLGDALTHLVVTPIIFSWVLGAPWSVPVRLPARWLEGALLAAGLVVTAFVALDTDVGATDFAEPRFYAPVPFLFWAAIRFGMPGATGAVAVIAFFAVEAALRGLGPFSGRAPTETAIALQHFLLLRAAPLYLVAVLIEQRNGIENYLRESEERFHKMADDAPVMVWVTDPTGSCSFVSKSWYDFTGQTPETALGFGWVNAVHPDDREYAHNSFLAANERREPFHADYRVRRHDGDYRWVIDSAAPRFAPRGDFLGYIGSVLDITERKRAEQTLRENEAELRASYDRIQDLAGRLITAQETERSRIARDLHDDVNQQLAGLSIALSNVKRRLQNGGDGTVQDEISRLQQRTADVVDMIRHLSHDLHPGVLQHAGLVAALRGYCAEFSREQGIEVNLSVAENVNGVPSDIALCLYRVAQEALRNIALHARAHKVNVALSSSADALELTIADDGQGFRLDKARGKRGLGLISLDERVRLLGGGLSINTELQRGTELRAEVPLRKTA